ncbi:MAG: type II secretion system protein [Phycisphaerales bacterium JB060]
MTARRAHLAPSRRGMTFLEAVLASALLGIVAMGVFGALNYLVLQQKRAEQIAGASEVANRVVVMYLDSPDNMPQGGRPIAYGRHLYRWTYESAPIDVFDPNATDEPTPLSLTRLRELTVSVWLHEDSGGAYSPNPSTPGIIVRRMLDPLATRNPDSFERGIEDGSLMEGITGGGGTTRSGGSQAPGGGSMGGG